MEKKMEMTWKPGLYWGIYRYIGVHSFGGYFPRPLVMPVI